jgi:hypothetical protein
MRRVVALLALCACAAPHPGGGSPVDSAPPAPGDTSDTLLVEDTAPPPTGCYDVPVQVTGGFAHYNDPFVASPPTGGEVAMVHGVQGAFWHLDTAIRVEAIHSTVAARPTVLQLSTGQLISGVLGGTTTNLVNLALTMEGECVGTTAALRAYLDDVDPDPGVQETLAEHICALEGEEVEVAWEVADLVDGRIGTASVQVTLALDPADVPLCAEAQAR